MDHQKIYDNIILNAKFQNRIKHREIYYEEHHIVPKCLGGEEEKENKVLLTAREHFVVHKLLTYIYKGHRGIALAFHRMAFSKNIGYVVSSRDYAYAMEIFRNTPISELTRQKHRDFRKLYYSIQENRNKCSQPGEKNGMYGKISFNKGKHLSTITKNKIAQHFLGKTLEELYGNEKAKLIKENYSKNRMGDKNAFFQKNHSYETKQIIAEKCRKIFIDREIIDQIKSLKINHSYTIIKSIYPEYSNTTLGRIVLGIYDKGYYEI